MRFPTRDPRELSKLTIRIGKRQRAFIQARALQSGTTVSEVVRKALDHYEEAFLIRPPVIRHVMRYQARKVAVS